MLSTLARRLFYQQCLRYVHFARGTLLNTAEQAPPPPNSTDYSNFLEVCMRRCTAPKLLNDGLGGKEMKLLEKDEPIIKPSCPDPRKCKCPPKSKKEKVPCEKPMKTPKSKK